ncbi:MAG: JAB domain-containing protein [Spirochaetia bacterium]
MRAEQRIAPRVIEEMREAIADADGNEVFFVGRRGSDGKVESVTVGARGNEEAVPVLSPHLEEGDVIIHNHPSGGLTPSGADLAIASRLGNQGIGFFIVDNQLDEVYVAAEPVEAHAREPLDEDEWSEDLRAVHQLPQGCGDGLQRVAQRAGPGRARRDGRVGGAGRRGVRSSACGSPRVGSQC